MDALSSPPSYPDSSQPTRKRSRQDDDLISKRPKVTAGFLVDDDSEDEEQDAQPPLKKQMFDRDSESSPNDSAVDLTVDSQEQLDTTATSLDPDDKEPARSQPSAFANFLDLASTSKFAHPSFREPERQSYTIKTCNGDVREIGERRAAEAVAYERIVAARSKTKEGRAKRAYYGIEISQLIKNIEKTDEAAKGARQNTPAANPQPTREARPRKSQLLWTEKYRARTFFDLCGDDGTNRTVLRWLKRWDPVVFPGAAKTKPQIARRPHAKQPAEEEKPHRKILMLAGPPGLGKTTLAHVCARQAGYEVLEVNASDDRSRDVVNNRIRTSLGTESVKNVRNQKTADGSRKKSRPVCVVVDEVDGAVTGSGGSGEGGFVKALIDLVHLDQRNSGGQAASTGGKRKKKDDFRLMRPLVLICNDVYHPSLRPLRQSNLAEIIHVGKPTIDAVVGRLKTVFEKEGIPCDKDAARRLCEAAWGMTGGIDMKRGAESAVEGDLRGVMVVGEWVAGRFRSALRDGEDRLTRQWIDKNVAHELASGGGGGRGLGRGGVKDIVGRLFQIGGGFPKQELEISEVLTRFSHEHPDAQLGFSDLQKRHTMEKLRQMIETSGEVDRVMTEIFSEFPSREFNDDSFLSKPDQAYDWLHFHDTCSSRLFGSQDWELTPYLSQSALACHHLFSTNKKHYVSMGYDKRFGAEAEEAAAPAPFSGPRADYLAHEAEKNNRSELQSIHGQLTPTLMRLFRSAEDVSLEFLPYLVRMISPDVKPVVVGGSQGSTASVRKESEKAMVKRAAETLAEVGISLQRGKIESDSVVSRGAQFVYRMDPDLDALSTFETATLSSAATPTRYAVRQVLDQELQRTLALRQSARSMARYHGDVKPEDLLVQPGRDTAVPKNVLAKSAAGAVKRDFFGRVIADKGPLREVNGNAGGKKGGQGGQGGKGDAYVTYHEGLNNAVRKPISLQEFLKPL